MILTGSLPPAFLVPAWSKTQLCMLGRAAATSIQSQRTTATRSYGTQAQEQEEHASKPRAAKMFVIKTHSDGKSDTHIRTHAARREQRFVKVNHGLADSIRQKQGTWMVQPQSTQAKDREQRAIAEYNKNSTKSLGKQSSARKHPLYHHKQPLYPVRTTRTPEEDVRELSIGTELDHGLFKAHGARTFTSPKVQAPVDGVEKSRQDSQTPSYRRINLHSAQPGARDAKEVKEARKPPQPPRSLLEELFPEQAAKLAQNQESKPRYIDLPVLDLPNVDDFEDDRVVSGKGKTRINITKETWDADNLPQQQGLALLILENALPNLVAADFRRISPKGKHIEEWKGSFDPVAIMPMRKGHMMQQTGKYYLVFKNVAHARAWRGRVELLHKIAKVHTPTSITSPVIPSKGFLYEGEDIGQTLREYSIFPPGVFPEIKVVDAPAGDERVQKEILAANAMLQRDKRDKAGRSVLLWVEGYSESSYASVRNMIRLDGAERNMAWGESEDRHIVEDYGHRSDEREFDDANRKVGEGRGRNAPKRWLVTLKDEAEARRFVRVWHMRPFPTWERHKQDEREEPWPLVKTELLW